MAGYKPQRQRYQITYDEFPGLDVVCRGMTIGQSFDMAEMEFKLQNPDETQRMAVFEFFSDRLVTWNLEHPDIENAKEQDEDGRCLRCGLAPGELMPTLAVNMMCLDAEFIMQVIFGYLTAVARGAVPKELSTGNGTNQIDMLMRKLGELQNPGQSFEQKQS